MLPEVHKKIAYRAAVLFILFVASLVVCSLHLRYPGMNVNPHARFLMMIQGKADRPFAYRMLLPTTVRLIVAVLPSGSREALLRKLGDSPFVSDFLREARLEMVLLPEILVCAALIYLSLVGFLIALRYLYRGLYRGPPAAADAVTIAALLLIPSFYRHATYMYDFPTLFLFTFGLALMVRRKFPAYLLVFVLGCANKETTIFLALVFALYFRGDARLSRRSYGKWLGCQIAAFGIIKGWLHYVFRNNPGAPIEFHLLDFNLVLPPPDAPLGSAFALLAIAFLIAHKWGEKPRFLRRAMWLLGPFLLLALFAGYLDEFRAQFEMLPILLMTAAYSVAQLLGVRLEVIEDAGGSSTPGADQEGSA